MSNLSDSFISKSLEVGVVFEDAHLLAVNKPAGAVVNQAKTVKEQTVQGWFVDRLGGEDKFKQLTNNKEVWQKFVPEEYLDKFGTPEEIFLQRQGIVHRLDRDTSGVLLLAKNPGTLVNLLAQFKQRKTKKKYLCLVHGQLRVESSVIRAPIARSSTNRHKFRVEIDGRSASTHYRVVDWFPPEKFAALLESANQELSSKLSTKIKKNLESYQQGFSLLECLPKTGRTHQIRVHLAHVGHPIVADHTYGGGKRSSLDKHWCPRQFLHASALAITHPATGKELIIKAPLCEDLMKVVERLG